MLLCCAGQFDEPLQVVAFLIGATLFDLLRGNGRR